uniref:Pleckstrin homology domain containing, family O member 2 n=1 Tax=Kryptolebias marmoratus TaxID=37003 RepID=A0A3Q3AYN4_KRYMA
MEQNNKAGWLKKSHGKLLASYKDRYIHVEKTEVVVYENEDLQNCLERFDLEKYDKCHELKSPFKKKHRLILIRSPKSGNKVHDVKFQTQSAEEKETWIKAISDCINRAKNKVFDEVKIDESINLEHVTRTRPKGNRNRRPPTRIHMKEVRMLYVSRWVHTSDSGNETTEPALETEEAEELSREKALPPVEGDQLESATAEERASDEETSDNDQQEPAAPQRKSPSPPLTSKKTPEKSVAPATQNKEDPSAVTQPDEARDSTASDTVPLQAPEAHPDSEVPSVVVSCNDPLSDSLGLLCHLSGEKKKAEEKSVDSGQHSDDESEGSGCEDTLATSTAALRGSNVGLDVLDASDDSDNIQVSVNLRPSAEPQVRPNVFPCRRSHPFQKPPKPLNKPKSASICDLLSESTKCTQMEAESTPALKDHVTKLETEVALEMDKTSELLSKAQGGSRGEDVPEDLLAKALEKLKKADHVLREVKKLKLTKNSMNRMSW